MPIPLVDFSTSVGGKGKFSLYPELGRQEVEAVAQKIKGFLR